MKNFKLKSIASGIILLVSSGILYFLIILMIHTAVGTSSKYRDSWEPSYRFVVDKNNQKLLLNYKINEKKVEVVEIYDLDKNLLRIEEVPKDNEANKYLAWVNCLTYYHRRNLRDLSGYINIEDISGQLSDEKWYFLTNQKYLIGYNKITAKVIGYIGVNGFSTELKDIHIFKDFQGKWEYRNDFFNIITDQTFFSILIKERKVVVIQSENDEKIVSISLKGERDSDRHSNFKFKKYILRSDKRIKEYSANGQLENSFILPKDILKQPFLSYLYNGSFYVNFFEGNYKTGVNSKVAEISAEGEVLWSIVLNKTGSLDTSILDNNKIAIPFTGQLAVNILSRFFLSSPFERDLYILSILEASEIGNINLSFWFSVILAILCMIFVYSHLVKRTDSKFIINSWLLIILIFSLPGVMAYLFYSQKTKLIDCTHCGKKFLPIKSTCLICSKEIPLGKTDGREIFTVT